MSRLIPSAAAGPEEQNVQKSQQAVRITHLPTGIVVTCQTERSQLQNKAIALKILYFPDSGRELQKQAEERA